MSDEWQKQVDWMRKNGVVSAKWENRYGTPIQNLVECILGPEPQSATHISTAQSLEDQKAALEKAKADAQQALDDLDFGAS